MNNQSVKYAVGIDLGGTFVKFALISSDGDMVFSDKLPIGAQLSREDILNVLHKAIEMTLDHAREMNVVVSGIGIGTPGVCDNGIVLGGAENLNGWINVDLSGIFSEAFHLPVLVDNDANVMGLGEAIYGAARNCSDVIFITVGTGIGGAVIVNGKLYGGYRNRGAELGHITVDHKGVACSCGGRGCLEAYASTSALIRQYAERTGLDERNIDGYYIVKKFNAGEKEAVECMQEHTDYLGHGIGSLVNVFAPQKVVVGGGISEAGQFYIDMIKAATFKYAMPDCAVHTDVAGAALGNRAGCLGAASLIFKNSGS